MKPLRVQTRLQSKRQSGERPQQKEPPSSSVIPIIKRPKKTWKAHYEHLATLDQSAGLIIQEWEASSDLQSIRDFILRHPNSCLLTVDHHGNLALLHNVTFVEGTYCVGLIGNDPKSTSPISFSLSSDIFCYDPVEEDHRKPAAVTMTESEEDQSDTNLVTAFLNPEHKSMVVVPPIIAASLIGLARPLSPVQIETELNDLEAIFFIQTDDEAAAQPISHLEVQTATNAVRDFLTRAANGATHRIHLDSILNSHVLDVYLNGRSPKVQHTSGLLAKPLAPQNTSQQTVPKRSSKQNTGPAKTSDTSTYTNTGLHGTIPQHIDPTQTRAPPTSTTPPPAQMTHLSITAAPSKLITNQPVDQFEQSSPDNDDDQSSSKSSKSDSASSTNSPILKPDKASRSKQLRLFSANEPHHHSVPQPIPIQPQPGPQTFAYHPGQPFPHGHPSSTNYPLYAPFGPHRVSHNPTQPQFGPHHNPANSRFLAPPPAPTAAFQQNPFMGPQPPIHIRPPMPIPIAQPIWAHQAQQPLSHQPYNYDNSILPPVLDAQRYGEKRINRKISKFYKLPDSIQMIYIRGSAVNLHDPDPPSPSPKLLDFLEFTKNYRHASYLTGALARFQVRGSFDKGHATKLATSGPLWPNPNYPEGLTVFAISSSVIPIDSERQKADLRDLKVQNKQKLSDTEYVDLTTKDWHIPRTPHQMDNQLYTYICTIQVLFGDNCFLAAQLSTWRLHLQAHWPIYEQYCNDFKTWGTKVLFPTGHHCTSVSPKPARLHAPR